MKRALFTLLLVAAAAAAQDEQRPNPLKVLAKLQKANQEKDLLTVETSLKEVIEIGQTSKSAEEVDPIAAELVTSFKLAKGNWGTMAKILGALGELRSKKGESTLKKLAFQKKLKEEKEAGVQAAAIEGLSKMANPRHIKSFGDVCKNRNMEIAKAAYACFKNYGTAKGKVRKQCAEILMKRLEAEKPSAGQSGTISAEQQERWNKLQSVIVASMQAICHEDTINDIENWREWWKENKRNPRAEAWKDKKKTEEG